MRESRGWTIAPLVQDDQNTQTAMAAPSAATADQRLKERAEAEDLEDFAEQADRARKPPYGLRQEANVTSRASGGRVPSR